MTRISVKTIEDNIKMWNLDHPEMQLWVDKHITGCRIRSKFNQETIVYGETSTKCWDSWVYFIQGYATALRLNKICANVKGD